VGRSARRPAPRTALLQPILLASTGPSAGRPGRRRTAGRLRCAGTAAPRGWVSESTAGRGSRRSSSLSQNSFLARYAESPRSIRRPSCDLHGKPACGSRPAPALHSGTRHHVVLPRRTVAGPRTVLADDHPPARRHGTPSLRVTRLDHPARAAPARSSNQQPAAVTRFSPAGGGPNVPRVHAFPARTPRARSQRWAHCGRLPRSRRPVSGVAEERELAVGQPSSIRSCPAPRPAGRGGRPRDQLGRPPCASPSSAPGPQVSSRTSPSKPVAARRPVVHSSAGNGSSSRCIQASVMLPAPCLPGPPFWSAVSRT